MLQVIQHQEALAISYRPADQIERKDRARVRETFRARQGRQDFPGVGKRIERQYARRLARALHGWVRSQRVGEARLAYTAGTGDGDEAARGRRQQRAQRGQVVSPADESLILILVRLQRRGPRRQGARARRTTAHHQRVQCPAFGGGETERGRQQTNRVPMRSLAFPAFQVADRALG